MSAQDFHGVTVSGTGDSHTIVNHSTRPVMGYAIQRHTTTGLKPVFSVVDLAGKSIKPVEERRAAMFSGLHVRPAFGPEPANTATADEEESIGYELKPVLFDHERFYGPDDVFCRLLQANLYGA